MDTKRGGKSAKSAFRSRLYDRWRHMLSRCSDQNHPEYHRYGGRGIDVCAEWRNFEAYYNWLLDNGLDEKNVGKLSVDRIDNDGPYSPDNCRLASASVQNVNKSNTRWVSDPETGEKVTMVEYAYMCGKSAKYISDCWITGKPLPKRVDPPKAHRLAAILPSGTRKVFNGFRSLRSWWLAQLPKITACIKGELDDVIGIGWYFIDDDDLKYKQVNGELKLAN